MSRIVKLVSEFPVEFTLSLEKFNIYIEDEVRNGRTRYPDMHIPLDVASGWVVDINLLIYCGNRSSAVRGGRPSEAITT